MKIRFFLTINFERVRNISEKRFEFTSYPYLVWKRFFTPRHRNIPIAGHWGPWAVNGLGPEEFLHLDNHLLHISHPLTYPCTDILNSLTYYIHWILIY